MKKYRILVILYSVLMIMILPVSFLLFKKIDLEIKAPALYTDEELVIYKRIWEGMNSSSEEIKNRIFVYFCILWLIIFVLGFIFLYLIYRRELKPILDMQKYANEISKGNLEVQLPIKKNNGFVDFTESFDLMRETLKEAKNREIEAENKKREMVAELSHDLKTPIATIQATCEVLNAQLNIYKANSLNEKLKIEENKTKKNKAEEKKTFGNETTEKITENKTVQIDFSNLEEKLQIISNKAEVINQLIQSVFSATLDDMDEIVVNVDAYSSVMIEDYFKGLKDYGRIILDNHIPECLVYMDRLRMEQVVDNIVGNSYKYAGTDIHVSFAETEDILSDEGKSIRYIKITVRDSGPGIPESDLMLVTEKYYRGNNAKDRQGYGLGLYLVKTYMERQNGGFDYHNDNGFVAELYVKKV